MEAKEAARETEALLRTWESLVSRGQQVPSVRDNPNDTLGDHNVNLLSPFCFTAVAGKSE